eukprot:4443910-Alexandrium_andersonii.AAC.1
MDCAATAATHAQRNSCARALARSTPCAAPVACRALRDACIPLDPSHTYGLCSCSVTASERCPM